MPEDVCFFVPGVPQPGGSKKGFVVKTRGGAVRAVVVEDAKHNAPWRAVVTLAASEYFSSPLSGPISVSFTFAMPRPQGHYGTGRNAGTLKPTAPHGHTIKPDITKLIRSTEDALKGVAWQDDCQVVSQSAGKFYGPQPGCWIRIQRFEDATLSREVIANSDNINPTGESPKLVTGPPEAIPASGAPSQPQLFEETENAEA